MGQGVEAYEKDALEGQAIKNRTVNLCCVSLWWMDTYTFKEWLFYLKHDAKYFAYTNVPVGDMAFSPFCP